MTKKVTSAELLKGTPSDIGKPFDRGPFPPEMRMIPARDGIEAQRGLNDVFPGDPYPAPAMGSSEWYNGPGRRVTASDAWGIVQAWLAQYEQEEREFSRYSDDVVLDGVMSAGLRRDLSALLNGRMPARRQSETCTQSSDGSFYADDEPLSERDQAMIDSAWESHKAAGPVAKIINDNQPGKTAIIEILRDPPTLGVGTLLYAASPAQSTAGEIVCPNCHDANKYGDYEGPTCDVCGGRGSIPTCHDCGTNAACDENCPNHDSALSAPVGEPVATKKVYIKPLRTIVEIQTAYADKIRDLLNTNPPAPAVGAEEVARIIDPVAWTTQDRMGKFVTYVNGIAPSLEKADAILSLLSIKAGGGAA